MCAQADAGTPDAIIREAIKNNPSGFPQQAHEVVKRVVKCNKDSDGIVAIFEEVRYGSILTNLLRWAKVQAGRPVRKGRFQRCVHRCAGRWRGCLGQYEGGKEVPCCCSVGASTVRNCRRPRVWLREHELPISPDLWRAKGAISRVCSEHGFPVLREP